jgi:aminopeptidase YwaD
VADRVVDVGTGTEEELQCRDLTGAIALVPNRRLQLPDLLENVQKRGAVGCIMVGRGPHDLISTRGLQRHGSPIPAVSIGYQDGRVLRDAAFEGPIRVFMKVQTHLEKASADNLLGILEGQGKPEEVWAIVAHYETVPTTPGANDNAVGVAVALEMLHAFSSLRLSRTLWLIFSTAEESNMKGMGDFVQQRKKELGRIQGLINLDVIGQGTTLWAIKSGELPPGVVLETSKRLNSALLGAAEDLGYQMDNTVTMPPGAGGLADAHPFAEAGVPVTWIRKGGGAAGGYGHTAEDTPDKLDINALKIPADILAVSLLRLDRETT